MLCVHAKVYLHIYTIDDENEVVEVYMKFIYYKEGWRAICDTTQFAIL